MKNMLSFLAIIVTLSAATTDTTSSSPVINTDTGNNAKCIEYEYDGPSLITNANVKSTIHMTHHMVFHAVINITSFPTLSGHSRFYQNLLVLGPDGGSFAVGIAQPIQSKKDKQGIFHLSVRVASKGYPVKDIALSTNQIYNLVVIKKAQKFILELDGKVIRKVPAAKPFSHETQLRIGALHKARKKEYSLKEHHAEIQLTQFSVRHILGENEPCKYHHSVSHKRLLDVTSSQSVLEFGVSLSYGETMTSPSGQYVVKLMEGDYWLSICDQSESDSVAWGIQMTNSNVDITDISQCFLGLQQQGMVLSCLEGDLWTNTFDNSLSDSSYLQLQDNGNLVLIDSSTNNIYWSSNTWSESSSSSLSIATAIEVEETASILNQTLSFNLSLAYITSSETLGSTQLSNAISSACKMSIKQVFDLEDKQFLAMSLTQTAEVSGQLIYGVKIAVSAPLITLTDHIKQSLFDHIEDVLSDTFTVYAVDITHEDEYNVLSHDEEEEVSNFTKLKQGIKQIEIGYGELFLFCSLTAVCIASSIYGRKKLKEAFAKNVKPPRLGKEELRKNGQIRRDRMIREKTQRDLLMNMRDSVDLAESKYDDEEEIDDASKLNILSTSNRSTAVTPTERTMPSVELNEIIKSDNKDMVTLSIDNEHTSNKHRMSSSQSVEAVRRNSDQIGHVVKPTESSNGYALLNNANSAHREVADDRDDESSSQPQPTQSHSPQITDFMDSQQTVGTLSEKGGFLRPVSSRKYNSERRASDIEMDISMTVRSEDSVVEFKRQKSPKKGSSYNKLPVVENEEDTELTDVPNADDQVEVVVDDTNDDKDDNQEINK